MSELTEIPEKIENAYHGTNSNELDPKKLIFVRMFNNKDDIKDGKLYASPFRPTVHFTINGPVSNHMYGSWSDAKYALITPFYDTVKVNKDNFLGGSSADMYFLGYANLPKGYKIIERSKNESYEHFKNRIVNEIKQRGYKVLEPGMWSAFNSITEEDSKVKGLYKKLENNLGRRYFRMVPSGTAIEHAKNYALTFTSENREKPLSPVFILEKLKELEINTTNDELKQLRKIENLDEFHNFIREHGNDVSIDDLKNSYMNWIEKKFYSRRNMTLQSDKFNLQAYQDELVNKLSDNISKEINKYQKELNEKEMKIKKISRKLKKIDRNIEEKISKDNVSIRYFNNLAQKAKSDDDISLIVKLSDLNDDRIFLKYHIDFDKKLESDFGYVWSWYKFWKEKTEKKEK